MDMKRTFLTLLVPGLGTVLVFQGLLRLFPTPTDPYFPIAGGVEAIREFSPPVHFGIVEFADDGSLQPGARDRQLDPLLARLRERPSSLVVFIHGWHGDASAHSEGWKQFRDALAENWKLVPHPGEQQAVGILLAWRGASSRIPVVRETTYGDRYRTALRISRSPDYAAVLGEIIAAARTQGYRSNVILIGHSMGGTILEGAYARHLETLLAEDAAADGSWCFRNHPRLADAVLLVNAASDWKDSQAPLGTFARAHGTMFPPGSAYSLTYLHRPVVTYMTSLTDSATHWLHPLGQGLFNFRWNARNVGQRPEFWTHRPHKVTADELLPGDERGAVQVTLDNYRDMFYFHPSGERGYAFLKYSGDVRSARDDSERRVLRAFDAPCAVAGVTYGRSSKDRHPVWCVPIVPDMVDGHNDIWHVKMRLLVTRFAQFTRLSPPAADERGEIGPLIRELARADSYGGAIGNISKGVRLQSQARVCLERRAVRDPDHLIAWLREARADWLTRQPRRTAEWDYDKGIEEIDFLLGIFGVPATPPATPPAADPAVDAGEPLPP
jgi:pimeloyl-ACP methyl ester carboxylesterase